ncbi:MAG TPA: hypothetical protein DET40_04065 [Lentisphaeria bacterium]|nr:MAG: hypothetical protein A2X45_01875 [Lentisphaerae bacterium GWF2_50_93]HCE42702.1 hypothetical protein [Lentisphaeria bacterium]
MKNMRISVLGTTVITAIAIGTLGFMSGCKSPEVLKDRPFIPPPSNQVPAAPAVEAPVLIAPPAAPEVKIIPAQDVVPK